MKYSIPEWIRYSLFGIIVFFAYLGWMIYDRRGVHPAPQIENVQDKMNEVVSKINMPSSEIYICARIGPTKNPTSFYILKLTDNESETLKKDIKNYTFVPADRTGQFNNRFIIGIKQRSSFYTFVVYHNPYNYSIEKAEFVNRVVA